MASVDALVKAKTPADEQAEHPKYKSFCELIEDFKSGEPSRAACRVWQAVRIQLKHLFVQVACRRTTW